MVSYNQELKVLNDIADAHLQLRSFGSGAPTEIGNETVYPLMWVTPQTNPVSITTKALNSQYKIIFADLVTADKGNEAEVLSDMKQVALDVVAQLQLADYQDLFTVEPNGRLEPFTEEAPGAGTADKIAGWILDITLRVVFLSDRCAVPSTLDPSATPGCAGASILKVGGVVLTVVESGGTIYTTDIIELMTPVEVIADFTTAGYLTEITETLATYRRLIFTFEATAALLQVHELEITGTFNTANVALTNIATVVYELNGVVVSGLVTVAKGDKLKVTITKTDSGSTSVVDIAKAFYSTVTKNITNYAIVGSGRYYFFIDNISSPNRLGRVDLSDSTITYFTLTAGLTYLSCVYRFVNDSVYIFAATQWCRLENATTATPAITDVTTVPSITGILWTCLNTKDDIIVLGDGSKQFNPANGVITTGFTGSLVQSRLRYSRHLNAYTSGEFTGLSVRGSVVEYNGTAVGAASVASGLGSGSSYDFYYNPRNGYYYLFFTGANRCYIFSSKNNLFYIQASINLTSINGSAGNSTIGIDPTRNYIFSSVQNISTVGGLPCSIYIINCTTNTYVGKFDFTTAVGERGGVYCTYNSYLDRYLIVPRSTTCSRIKVFNPNNNTFDADITITPVNTNLTANAEQRLFVASEINYEMS